MSKNDLQSDLLADLQGAANARPLPSETPLPSRPALPELTEPQHLRPPTPSVNLRFTPLRWGRPGLEPVEEGMGVGLRLGPLRISVALSS